MITIDGSMGEGGGQIVRSSLALAMITRRAVRLVNIRAHRARPGLRRQHVTAVEAAARVSSGRVEGASVGSQAITFQPGPIVSGVHAFSIGSAGSTTLVLQTILPALLCASGPSTITLDGGTHNPLAPPLDFLQRCYLPLVNRMGPAVTAQLERWGFAPAGGGRMTVHIEPCRQLRGFNLLERGQPVHQRARAIVANLPRHIAEREADVIRRRLGWPHEQLSIEVVDHLSTGPGNVVMIEAAFEHVTEIVTAFGQKGVKAEQVARRAVEAYLRYAATDAPVGEHLADQILLPLAIAGSGSFRTRPLSEHAATHIELIRRFLDVDVQVETSEDETVIVRIVPARRRPID